MTPLSNVGVLLSEAIAAIDGAHSAFLVDAEGELVDGAGTFDRETLAMHGAILEIAMRSTRNTALGTAATELTIHSELDVLQLLQMNDLLLGVLVRSPRRVVKLRTLPIFDRIKAELGLNTSVT